MKKILHINSEPNTAPKTTLCELDGKSQHNKTWWIIAYFVGATYTMSRKRVIVTTSWDDGHSLKDGILPALLNEYGIKTTFYITKESMRTPEDATNLMMLDKTFEIGAHTLSHPDLTKISINEAREEIVGSKKWLEQLLGHEINLFAYPYGSHNKELSELIRTSGFVGSRTLNFDINPPKNPYMIGIGCTASNEAPRLRLKAALKSKLCFKSLADWETNAKLLFDSILEKGGVWHLWGHAWQIKMNNEWDKLEEVFKHVSYNPNVSYMANGQIINSCIKRISYPIISSAQKRNRMLNS